MKSSIWSKLVAIGLLPILIATIISAFSGAVSADTTPSTVTVTLHMRAFETG